MVSVADLLADAEAAILQLLQDGAAEVQVGNRRYRRTELASLQAFRNQLKRELNYQTRSTSGATGIRQAVRFSV